MESGNAARDGEAVQARIAALVGAIHDAERELASLTGGELDAIVSRSGEPFLLRDAQTELARSRAEAVRASEILETILEAIQAPVILVDASGTILAANGAWRQLMETLALPYPNHAVSINYLDVLAGMAATTGFNTSEIRQALFEVLAGRMPLAQLEFTMIVAQRSRSFAVEIAPLRSGPAGGAVILHFDLTARRDTEQALQSAQDVRRTDRALQDIAEEYGRIGGWRLELSPHRLVWSDQVCEIQGVPKGTVPSREMALGFYTPEHRPVIAAAVDVCINEGRPFDLELQLRTAGGEVRWVRVIGREVRNERNERVAIHGAFQDIHERKQAEELIRRQVERATILLELPRLAESLDERAFMQRAMELTEDATGSSISFIHLINEGGEDIELVAWSRRTLEHYCTAAFDSHYPVSQAGIWADALREGRPIIFNDYPNYPHQKGLPEGHSALQRLISVPVFDNGRVVMLAGVGNKEIDYTEFDGETVQLIATAIWQVVTNARATKSVQEAKARLDRLAAHVPGALYQFQRRPDGTAFLPYASEGVRDVFGVAPEQLVQDAAPLFAVMHPDDVAEVQESIQESSRTLAIWRQQLRVTLPDGQLRWVEGTATPESQPDGSVLWHGYALDITERILREDALRKLTRAVEQTNVTIVVTDRLGNIEYANPYFEKSTGYSFAEAIGQNPRLLQSGATAPETYASMWETILGGDEWRGELLNKRKDGSTFWERVVISPVRDPSGAIANFVAVKEDITTQKQLAEERIKLQAQLNHSQKLESVGRLAGGIAHDFNNLLTVINGTAELALSSPEPEGAVRADFKVIQEAAQRAAALTRQLLTFSRSSVLEVHDIDTNEVVAHMSSMLRRIVGEDVAIATECAADAGVVRMDVGQLEQVITNLAVNARDAMPQGGRVRISTASVRLVEETVPGLPAGEYVRVTVRDTGTGMSAEVQERLFEPFFTTKPVGKGTGLGLAIVHSIVSQSGGAVTVDSTMGEGTAVHVFLPRQAHATDNQVEDEHIQFVSGNGTVLVVDDEGALGQITQRILQRAGYSVLLAQSGEEAMRLVENLPHKLDLLVSDVIMPGMSGPELAIALRERDPGLRVMFVSGHSGEILANHGLTEQDYVFVAKPYLIRDLTKQVQRALTRT